MYWLTGILGMVLVFAPFILGFANNAAALWTSLIVGMATIILSWMEGVEEDSESWEYWIAGVLGLVAIAAPFVFGFSAHAVAMWTSVVVGVLIAILAGSKLTTGQWRET